MGETIVNIPLEHAIALLNLVEDEIEFPNREAMLDVPEFYDELEVIKATLMEQIKLAKRNITAEE